MKRAVKELNFTLVFFKFKGLPPGIFYAIKKPKRQQTTFLAWKAQKVTKLFLGINSQSNSQTMLLSNQIQGLDQWFSTERLETKKVENHRVRRNMDCHKRALVRQGCPKNAKSPNLLYLSLFKSNWLHLDRIGLELNE